MLVTHLQYYLTHPEPNIEMSCSWVSSLVYFSIQQFICPFKCIHFNWYIFLLLIDWLHHVLGSASFNSPNANIMQNKRVVRGNTYAQRVPMRTYNVTSTLEERDQLAIPGTPGIAQRRLLHQRGQMLPNLADGQIQVSLFFIYRSSHIIFI